MVYMSVHTHVIHICHLKAVLQYLALQPEVNVNVRQTQE